MAGIIGKLQTMRASLQVDCTVLQAAEATNTVPTDGPKPVPTMVSKSPPVRLHNVTRGPTKSELQPARPVTTGSEKDTALGNEAGMLFAVT